MRTKHEYRAAVEEIARAAISTSPGDGDTLDILDGVWHEVEFSAWTDEHWTSVMRYTRHPNAVHEVWGGGLHGCRTAAQVGHRMAAAAMIEDILAEVDRII